MEPFRNWSRCWLAAALALLLSPVTVAVDAVPRIFVPPPNSAPTLNATSASLNSIVEDAAATDTGTRLTPLLANIYGDVNANNNRGVAITFADNGHGTWQYTTDNSLTTPVWIDIGQVSDANALLLHYAVTASGTSNAAIRFRPAANYNTLDLPAAMLTLRAWDETDGLQSSDSTTARYTSTSTTNGGTTAYSTTTLSCLLTINQVNDAAPVLDASSSSSLLPTYFGQSPNLGTPILALLPPGSSLVTDADDPYGDRGVAIVGLSSAVAGTWQFTTNGGTSWTNFSQLGVVSTTRALVLASGADRHASIVAGTTTALDTRVRFLPSSSAFVGTIPAAVSFRAWDQSDGINNGSGSIEDTSTNGGTSPFSTAIRTASLTIYDTSGQIPSTPVGVPAIALSSPGETVYTPLSAATAEGAGRILAALSGRNPSQARGFTWDPTLLGGQGDYVELPAQPSGGLQPSTGVFIATRVDLGLNLAGAPFAMPYAITLQPGWNFVGVPVLSDGSGGVVLTHPWVDFELRDDTGTAITTDPQFTQVLGDPLQPGVTSTTEPFLWDGTAYRQVTQLETGKGYWIKNNATTVYTINRIATASTPNPRLAGSPGAAPRGAAPKSASGPFVDRGSPPPPPAETSSGAHAQGGSCGHGSGIAAFAVMAMLALRAFSARLAARRR